MEKVSNITMAVMIKNNPNGIIEKIVPSGRGKGRKDRPRNSNKDRERY